MDPLHRIAETKMREAIENGAFDNLALKGKPLVLPDLSRVPQELRAGYSVLKSAGYLPEEMELKKEILTLQDLLDACRNDGEARVLRTRLSAKTLRFQLLMEKRSRGAVHDYRGQLEKRFG